MEKRNELHHKHYNTFNKKHREYINHLIVKHHKNIDVSVERGIVITLYFITVIACLYLFITGTVLGILINQHTYEKDFSPSRMGFWIFDNLNNLSFSDMAYAQIGVMILAALSLTIMAIFHHEWKSHLLKYKLSYFVLIPLFVLAFAISIVLLTDKPICVPDTETGNSVIWHNFFLIYVPTRRGDEIFYVSNFTIIGIITVVVTVIVVIYEFKAIVCLIIEIHAKMAEAKLAEVKEETKEAEVELESELEKPVDEEKEVA